MYASAEYGGINVPEGRFEAIDVVGFASTYTMNLTDEGILGYWCYDENWGIDEGFGHSFYFVAEAVAGSNPHGVMTNYHYFPFLWFKTGQHAMTWYDSQGLEVSTNGLLYDDTIDSYVETFDDMQIAEFTVKCKHVMMFAWVGYNGTTYSTCYDAWVNDALSVKWAIQWDELGTGLNSWNLIAMMLFYQVPSEFPHPIGLIIGMPIWALESILIFQIILSVIKSLPFT